MDRLSMSPAAARTAGQRQLLLQRCAQSRARLHEQLRQAAVVRPGRSAARRVLLELAIACVGIRRVAMAVAFAVRAMALAQAARRVVRLRRGG
jgi:hypothetical protein